MIFTKRITGILALLLSVVLRFDAAKRRGPRAVYGFSDCSAVWPELGIWSKYSVGAEFIS